MLSTSNLKSAQAATYFEKDDYYSQEECPNRSRWAGAGAERLNLSGGVEQQVFQQVLQGQSPEGQPLFSRRIDPATRRAATDFTFSAPKSVSVAALVQGDQRVIEAHHTAVDRALQVLEERYAQTRVTTETGRRTVQTGNLIAAVFPHGTSREAEPQLHSHCVIMNATQLEDGRWYRFSNDSAIMNKKLLGQIYQNELAVELKKIGYEVIQREHGQFDIEGYSPELLETFSTRRAQIEALMAEWQASGKPVRDADGNIIRSDVLLRELANLQTRQAKPQIVEASQLLQNWQSVLAVKGLSLPELPGEQSVVKIVEEITTATPSQIISDAIAHCGERDAIFRTTAIEKFAFEHHLGELSITELQQAIASHPELLSVDEAKGKVTTESALQLELATIRLMQQGQGQVSAIAPAETVATHIKPSKLSAEQRGAIALSCQSTDQFIGWQGAAGAGKTYALSTFQEIAEAQGYEVSGYAPSAAAAHELGESLNIETNTVARLLLEASLADAQIEKKRKRKLWLIDEAGLLNMREAQALLTRATDQQTRVVFVGDTRQLSAVEAGNPFRSLQAGGMLTAHLDQARRQQQAELRQAVQMISQGEVGAGIQVLESAGCISEIKEAQARGDRLVCDYLNLPVEERQQTLLLSGTNANRLALTEKIRAGMQAEGSLGENVYTMESLQRKDLTRVQGRYASSYETGDVLVPIRDYKRQGLERNEHYRVRAVDAVANTLTLETKDHQLIQIDPARCDRKAVYRVLTAEIAAGDRLKWTKNNRIAHTRNGQQFTVESITPEGIAQTVTNKGETRTIDLKGAQHIDYAWVSTTYSSQGKTASNVMALIDETTNKEAFYVATSRAKNRVQLYTSSAEDLQQLAEKTRANENVSDYLPLFELVPSKGANHEQTTEPLAAKQPAEQPPADYAREAASATDHSSSRRQPTADGSPPTPGRAHGRNRSDADPDVSELRRVLAGIQELRRSQELASATSWIKEAAQSINSSAKQLALAAAGITRLYGQLGEQLEKKAERRRTRNRRNRSSRRLQQSQPVSLEIGALREQTTLIAGAEASMAEDTAMRSPDETQPLMLQPPTPDTPLAQQLDAFASTLGYEPGDRIYVRALLPKHLSDDLALKHGLKFEIEENGQKRLIPNTRRGYLTVGPWEFTHIRKEKEPVVYVDGLAQLSELNQQGRGIYFVVNPGGERDTEITQARSLFWESDNKTKAEQLQQVSTSGLPVGAIVETHQSIHCYSPLASPLQDLGQWSQLQERLIQRMDSDAAIRNSSRLMRLPGFDHVRVQEDEQLMFSPVTLRHVAPDAKATLTVIDSQLPQWDADRWQPQPANRKQSNGIAATPTIAADNPWDIRNFAQYLNGDQHSQNGWLQVQCPEHGGEGHSGNSLHINESTGQYKCHGGCDSQAVYTAAWELAESRGWQPPKKAQGVIADSETTQSSGEATSATAPPKPISRWERYSAGIDTPPGPQRDLQIAKNAISDGLSKKQVIALLAKNSPKAQRLYRDEGSTPAYNYVEMVVKAAQQSNRAKVQLKSKGLER